MNKKLAATLLLLVLLPLGIMTWAGFLAVNEDYKRLELQVQSLLQSKLAEIDSRISRLLEERQRELRELPEFNSEFPYNWSRDALKLPTISQVFAQNSDGRLLFPIPQVALTEAEQAFLQRTQAIFDDKFLLRAKSEVSYPVSSSLRQTSHKSSSPSIEDGWHPWFWDTDIHLLYWRRTSNGGLIGAEISRIRLLADIIAMLPDTSRSDPILSSGSIILADANNRLIFRWGSSKTKGIWCLQFNAEPGFFSQQLVGGISFQIFSGLLTLAMTLVGLALFLYREHTRELREAEQRVNFVNQVSHELKTPLTNIRMYAELMEERLPEDDPENKRRLEIIILESRRLSRLINNVLTFSKHQKGKIHPKPRNGIPDQTILAVVESFRPALIGRDLSLKLDLNASSPMDFDPDILEQILGNLLSNVEKYAQTGKRMILRSAARENRLFIWVRDFGEGIPLDKLDVIFKPFARLSDRVHEGVSGTGIGLTIARELSRLHGGDLLLVWSNGPLFEDVEIPDSNHPMGACFRANISSMRCPPQLVNSLEHGP
ncbi:HAMP domain-containing histidine kinase [bacterium]|nr:HAMP domain-containing histidine kinase [bacterium]